MGIYRPAPPIACRLPELAITPLQSCVRCVVEAERHPAKAVPPAPDKTADSGGNVRASCGELKKMGDFALAPTWPSRFPTEPVSAHTKGMKQAHAWPLPILHPKHALESHTLKRRKADNPRFLSDTFGYSHMLTGPLCVKQPRPAAPMHKDGGRKWPSIACNPPQTLYGRRFPRVKHGWILKKAGGAPARCGTSQRSAGK